MVYLHRLIFNGGKVLMEARFLRTFFTLEILQMVKCMSCLSNFMSFMASQLASA